MTRRARLLVVVVVLAAAVVALSALLPPLVGSATGETPTDASAGAPTATADPTPTLASGASAGGSLATFVDACTGDTVQLTAPAAATAQTEAHDAGDASVALQLTAPVLSTTEGDVVTSSQAYSTAVPLAPGESARIEHVFTVTVGSRSQVQLRYRIDLQADQAPVLTLEQISGFCQK
jgi:hypothetical protein